VAAAAGQADQQPVEPAFQGAQLTGAVSAPALVGYVCPRCKGPLDEVPDRYHCAPCGAEYPVVCGIPDFRVAADPWIGLEDDRDKARRLEERTAGRDFEATVREYWAMTPATAPEQAERFIRHVLGAEERSRQWLAAAEGLDQPEDHGPWLDLGCGTGDLMAAAPADVPVVGVDIALRWLVAARKRPGATGPRRALVCACAEALPLPDGAMSRVLSLGAFEHLSAAGRAAVEARRVLATGGVMRLRTLNRYTPLAEPHVNVWGVGWVPRRWADSYVRWRSGQRYLFHRPLSPRELGRALAAAGFRDVTVRAARLLPCERGRLGAMGEGAARLVDALRDFPVAGSALTWLSHLIEARGTVQ
jgi:SAM-dependent methyltransferase